MSERFRREINNKAKKNIIAKGNEILAIQRIPFGSLSLEAETGGGVPVGRITSLTGEYSSGKTAVALKVLANFQTMYPDKDCYWIDAEGAWDPLWAASLGVDPDKVFVARPEYGEQAYTIALGAIDDNAGIVFIDSVAALSSRAEMEKGMDDVLVAPMARVNARFMRKMGSAFEKHGDMPPTLVLLNQLRQNVSGYGPPMIEPGGEALNYYPSLKILLKKGDFFDGRKSFKSNSTIDEGDEPKAQQIKFFTEKNKTAPPKRRGYVWFYFDNLDRARPRGSFDRLEEVIRYTEKYGVVVRRGKFYDLINHKTGEVRTFEGSARVASYIRDNDDVKTWVEQSVMDRVLHNMTHAEEIEDPTPIQKEQVSLRVLDVDEEEREASSG